MSGQHVSPRAGQPQQALGFTLLAVMFFVSGLAALLNETVWTRWLALALGSSARGTVVVLCVFMAGLGAGALWSGRLADRDRARALRWFAIIELVIGAWAWLTIPLVGELLPSLAARLAGGDDVPLLALRWRIALAVLPLAVPTFLMGATLPLVSRWAVDRGLVAPRAIGWLYALNTLGGAAGALLAALWSIVRFGLSGTVGLAGGLEIACGALAWWLSRRYGADSPAVSPRAAGTEPASTATAGDWLWPVACGGYLVSGFVGLGLEVACFRMLQVLLGSSSYALAAMLAAFLFGIGLGSVLLAPWCQRAAQPQAPLALTLGTLAGGGGLSLALLALLGRGGTARLPAWLGGSGGASMATELCFCALVLIPGTVPLGAAVPAISRVAAALPAALAARFSRAYAANTLGAVLGAALTGFVLIPAFGTAATVRWLLGLALSAAVVVAFGGGRSRWSPRTAAAALGIGAFGLWCGLGADPSRAAFDARFGSAAILTFDEGPVQTIAVVAEKNPQQLSFLRLVSNQTSLTGTHLYARRYMGLLGHLPVLYADDPRRALVICLGTGMTAAAVASHPEVERVDVVEISPEVAAAAPLFAPANDHVLSDRRVVLTIEDGRHALLAARRPYGVITLEPPPPRDAGVVSLYSSDFYALARTRLAPGGVVAQWIPLHSQSEAEVKILIRTFVAAFPHAVGVLPVERDLILLGSERPLRPQLDRLQRRCAAPTAAAALETIGFEDPAALLATVLLDREALDRYAGDAAAVSDDRPSIEHFSRYGRRPPLPPTEALRSHVPELAALLAAPPASQFAARFERARQALLTLLDAAAIAEAGGASASWQERFDAALALRPQDRFLQFAAQATDEHLAARTQQAEAQRSVEGWLDLARRWELRARPENVEVALRQALALAPDEPRTLIALGKQLYDRGRFDEAAPYLNRAAERLPSGHPLATSLRAMVQRGAR